MSDMKDEHDANDNARQRLNVPHPQRHPVWRILRKCLLALCVCCLVAFIGLCLFIDRFGHRDFARPAPAIVILGAGVTADHQAGDSLRARTLQAVALYRRHYAGKIICTGGVGDFPPAEAQAEAALARQLGVPGGDLLLEMTSRNTEENTRNAARICRQYGWSRVVAVSDPYHLWRVKRDFAAVGITAYTSPALNCQRDRYWPLRVLWTMRDALAVTRDVVR